MNCEKCNTPIPAGERICSRCGTPVPSEEQSSVGPNSNQKSKVSSFILWIILVLLLIVVGSMVFKSIAGHIQLKDKSKIARMQIELIDEALQQYKLDVMRYPSQLECLMENLDHEDSWDGPYIKPRVPLDPWGNSYYYDEHGERGYELYTLGADNEEGGEGENADIGVKGR